jgi:1-deoxy-D-xylulose-5-phosphate synthase
MAPGDSETTATEAGASPLLDSINSPRDLKALSMGRLGELAQEIRERIIATAAENGGHLAPHLGVVELTLALHYVFDTDRDKLIWDVGHQCYAHKLVTGRREQFHTIRKKGGLGGYPKRDESPYDAFGVGHSSTSISAGLGMAVARDRNGEDYRVVSVIGDGAMTGGQAFEALAHAGHLGTDLLVVLNDNNMSISPNVGALSAYFSRLITGGLYNRARDDFHGVMERMLGAGVKKAAQRIESSVKGMVMPGTMFEELGFKYVGPVDGHDIDTLVDCFTNLKKLHTPVFFHCVTQKGKGYTYAEKDPQTYHGVKAFDIETGEFHTPKPSGSTAMTFTDAFAASLTELAKEDERIVAVTAAMGTGTGLSKVEKEVPGRVFDVGICEQHAVTFAAGLATQGLRPVCAIYSTFLQRGFDQCLHDVCIQNLPVVFAIDRAGAVGEDSPTQQGAFDLSFLRPVPNLTILAPRDGVDTAAMLRWALTQDGPVAFRYARSKAPTIGDEARPEDVTCGEILRDGTDATLLAVGPVLSACLQAAEMLQEEGLSIRVADARCVKPLDETLMARIEDAPILTVEENTLTGGFGAAVLEYFERKNRLHEARVRRLGFPDAFIAHATRDEQLATLGLDADGIAKETQAFLRK